MEVLLDGLHTGPAHGQVLVDGAATVIIVEIVRML